jgi:hypothetical protein
MSDLRKRSTLQVLELRLLLAGDLLPTLAGMSCFRQIDVSDDGRLSPIDALLVPNHINQQTSMDQSSEAPYDVNRTGGATTLDVLCVINDLNSNGSRLLPRYVDRF